MRMLGIVTAALVGLWSCDTREAAPDEDSTESVEAGSATSQAAGSSATPVYATDSELSARQSLPMPFRVIWEPWFGDFDAMVERRIVRAVVPFGGYQFYYDHGNPRGASYDLLQKLETHINQQLDSGHLRVYVVTIPVSRDELIPAVLDGHADLVAADLTITQERQAEIAFARPMLTDINEIVVTGPAAPELATIDDLSGQEVVVRRSSSYFEHLQTLSAGLVERGLDPPDITEADELLEAEDLLEMINGGMIGITVLDDYKARFWSGVFPAIVVRDDLIVNEGGAIAWAMRKDNPGLASALQAFLRRYGKGTLVGNDTYNRYLSDASKVRCSHTQQALDQLSDLVDVFRTYGDRFGFDWLMLAAQAYQESRLQQDRRSSAGAVGIMQIKPSTAADRNVGVDDISTVEGNVHAGTKYMRFLADRYFSEEGLDELNQWLFTLAAYNAGPARIRRYRREAAEHEYDPNRWFDNVEIIAARRIGRETVTYVSNVFKYYVGYQMTVERGAVRESRYGDTLAECNIEVIG